MTIKFPRTYEDLKKAEYVYDVEITQTSGGVKTRVIEGQITVFPQVTST